MLRKKHLLILYSKFAGVFWPIPATVLIQNHTTDNKEDKK
jgi:hypothetical protein